MKLKKNYLEGGNVDVDSFRYNSGIGKYPVLKGVFDYIGEKLDRYVFRGLNEFLEGITPEYGLAPAVENEPPEWGYNSMLLNKALGRA